MNIPKTFPSFFLHVLKPHKRYVAAMILVSCLWAIHTSLLPFILKLIIDGMSTSLSGSALVKSMQWPVIGYIGLSLFLGALFRTYDTILMIFLPQLKRDVQHTMFVYLEGHSHRYFQDHFAGALANKITDMVRGVSEVLQMGINTCIDPFFAITFALIMVGAANPIFACILGGWAVLFITTSWFLAQKSQPYVRAYAESKSVVSGKIVDSLSNITNVRLFARKTFENSFLAGFTDDVMAKDRAVQKFLIIARIILMLSITTMLGLMITSLVLAKSRHLISIGDVVMILTVTGKIADNLWQITNQFVRLSQEIGSCVQALTIVTKPHELTDSPSAKPLKVTEGEIAFKNVNFGYQKNHLFKDLSLDIKGGSKVGLVGFSGSGKSSFINLILRLFDTDSGQICIDGQPIMEVTQDSLYQSISMIPQDTALFHRTLLENIRYGNLSATDDQVITASKKAFCHEFISDLPQGYQSLVGERGIKLSGGQRQRIAIARAILKDAPILILDEATSSLDSVTESLIQESLHSLMQNRTTLVIAHRLSTVSQMDRLLVFDKGQIIQDGTHDSLLKQTGHYQHLWELQSNGFFPEN